MLLNKETEIEPSMSKSQTKIWQHLYNFNLFNDRKANREISRGVIAKVLDYSFGVSEFDFQSRYRVHFREHIKPLIS